MSKEAGFVVPGHDHGMAPTPSAPPSYEEAMQHATVPAVPSVHTQSAYAPYPQQMPMPIPMPMQMPMPAPQAMPMQPHPMQAPQQIHVGSVPQGVAIYPTSNQPTRAVVVSVPLGRERCALTCPSCSASIRTETTEEVSGVAHLCCCLLFAIGCWLCSCLPYCLESCKTVKHKCPNCHSDLGMYRPY